MSIYSADNNGGWLTGVEPATSCSTGRDTSNTLISYLDAFILDRRSTCLSMKTIEWHKTSLKHFLNFCTVSGIYDVMDITAPDLRKYIIHCENCGYTPGGVHCKWRSVHAFFSWLEIELDDTAWKNPIRKIKVRKPNVPPLDPADLSAIKAILYACDKKVYSHVSWLGLRDKVIVLMLLDTGMRQFELRSLVLGNVNLITGVIQIVHGKGGKSRTVYIGRKTRQFLRRYISAAGVVDHLIINERGDPLTKSGLMQMLRRRAKQAGVPYQSAHSFRRLFALTMLRNGVDIYSLQMLMGHADLQVLKRYLKLSNQDTQAAHIKGCPVERLL